MQRDSSTSDWDMMAPSSGEESKRQQPEVAATATAQRPLPLPQAAFHDDDFFSSEQFHRVESAELHWSPAQSTDKPLSGRREVAPTFQPQGSDADVDSPLPGRNRHESDPATPPTNGSGGTPSQRIPPHIDIATLQQGFPSSASVESLFSGGVFHHFSPYAASKHASGGGGMKHSYSSSSAATPTSPPPYGGGAFLEATAASAAAVGNVVCVPPASAVATDASAAAAAAVPSDQQPSNRPPYYFRPPLVPKLSLTAVAPDPSAMVPSPLSSSAVPEGLTPSPIKMASDYLHGVRSKIRPSLAACLTPRIPSFLCANANVESAGASSSVLGDSQQAVMMWDDPLNALVKWTMAMLTLDVLHTFSSDSNTWAALTGRTVVLLMLMGKVAQVVQHGTPLASAATLRGRLTEFCDQRREGWTTKVALATSSVTTFVLGGGRGVEDNSTSSASSSGAASTAPRSAMDVFHIACRFGLVCGALDLVLRHSPYAAHRLLEVAIFWASFMSLRVPLRLVLSECLSRGNRVAMLRASCIGSVGTSYLVKSIPSHGVALRRGPADVTCWLCLQVVFAACALF